MQCAGCKKGDKESESGKDWFGSKSVFCWNERSVHAKKSGGEVMMGWNHPCDTVLWHWFFMYFSSDALSRRVSPPPKVWRNSCNTPVTLVALHCHTLLYNFKNRNSESSTRQYKDTVISQTRTWSISTPVLWADYRKTLRSTGRFKYLLMLEGILALNF